MESERKRQILDSAERLFSERGYHATSMRELAQELELKGGSLYSHISGKEELLWRILERATGEFMASIQVAMEQDGSPLERLRAAIRGHVRVITNNPDAATVYFHEWKFLGEPGRSLFMEQRNRYERLMRSLVSEAIEQGELKSVESRWATLLILSVLNWLYHWYDPAGPLTPDEIADKFMDMIFQGMERPEATEVPGS